MSLASGRSERHPTGLDVLAVSAWMTRFAHHAERDGYDRGPWLRSRLPRLFLLLLALLLQPAEVAGELLLQFGGFLVLAGGERFADLVLQEDLALGDFGL